MTHTTNSHRVVFRIEVPGTVAEKFAAICEETGVSHIATTSKLVQWFAKQDPETQSRVLGMFGPGSQQEATKLILRKLANA